MRAVLLVALALGCALVGGNLVGLSFTDYATNYIVSINPANASNIAQSVPFNSQWLYAISSTIDINGGNYYLFTMNATGAWSYALSLGSFSSVSAVALSEPQIYCTQFDTVSKSIIALSQNDTLIVQLVRLNPATGDITTLYSFPNGWMIPYFTSTLVASTYVAVLNTPTGQMLISYNISSGAIRQMSLGSAGLLSLATDGTAGSVLALRMQNSIASLTRQSLTTPTFTTVASLPSSVTLFQYASTVSAGSFYIAVRSPASVASPLLLSVNLSSSSVATQPLPNNTYLAYMQSTTL